MYSLLCLVFASANNAVTNVLVHPSPQGYYFIRIDSKLFYILNLRHVVPLEK